MIILLTGKDGQVGFELQRALAGLGTVVAVGREECDLCDAQALRALVRRIQPDVIVNPAAYTAVDRAETDVDSAFSANAIAPGVLGEEAEKLGALVIHFSTDYVFDGKKSTPYNEADVPNPQNVYGRSKYAGECALAQATPRHLIMRTSWVLGAHGGNFAKSMLKLAADRDQLTVVADQFGAPTSAALLADATAHIVRQYQQQAKDGFPFGTYHVAAAGETTWYDYARFVIGEGIAAGQSLKTRPESVKPIPGSEYRTAAVRPSNSRLDTKKFRDAFVFRLPDWQSGVRDVLQQIFRE